jgi:hypothetical protein
MLDLVFGFAIFVGMPTFFLLSQHWKSKREWKMLALNQAWSPQTGHKIQTTVADRSVTITRPRPSNFKKYEWALMNAAQMTLQLEFPRYLPTSTVRRLLQDTQEADPRVESWRLLFSELEELKLELSAEDGPATSRLCLATRMHENFYTLPSHVQMLGQIYKAIDRALLHDLRQLAESESWILELEEAWSATDSNGHSVLQIHHAPYRATICFPIPKRAPTGLRIRARDASSRGSHTGHPILDQFVQIETDDSQQLLTLVESPSFCEVVLELVQGLSGEVDHRGGYLIFTQEELLLEPSTVWQRLSEMAKTMVLP